MIESSPLIDLLVIFVFALLSHGVMLLNDGLYWDGWLVDSWQRTRNWPVMKRFYSEVGMPLLYLLHRLLGPAPARIFMYRLIAFASTVLSAAAVYCLSVRIGVLSEPYSLLLALLYLSYTGYHMNVDTVVGIQYTLPTALFYWAAYLALAAQDYSGVAHWGSRVLALGMFFLAFNANSTLVYYFGFLALKILLPLRSVDASWISIFQESLRNIDFIVLPFAFWVLKNKLTPRHGHYADYNRIRIDPMGLLFGLLNAVRHGLEAPIIAPIRGAVTKGYLWIPSAAFILAYIALTYSARHIPPLASSVALGSVVAGGALFFLAALPYVLVGQPFFPLGWNTKHHMLFHLPVALITLGLAGLLLSGTALVSAIVAMLVANAAHLNLTYLHHLAVSVKNRSWLHKLSRSKKAENASIFLVTDLHSIRGDPSNPDQEHRPAYLFYMFEWLWADKRRCGFPVAEDFHRRLQSEEVSERVRSTTLDYDMQNVDRRGGQIKLVITDGLGRSPIKVAVLYLKERYFTGGKLEALLESVTTVKLVAI